jgi:hypothetical protein
VGKMVGAEVASSCRRGEDELAPAAVRCSQPLMGMAPAVAMRCRGVDLHRRGGGAVNLCGLAE